MGNSAYNAVMIQCLWLYGPTQDVDGKETRYEVSKLDWENAIALVEQRILNYCTIKTIPKSHYYTWALITVDFINYWVETAINPTTDDGEDGGSISGSISDIKVGDVNVKIGAKEVDTTNGLEMRKRMSIMAHSPNLDRFLLNYKDDLMQIRRMKWGV